MTTAASATRGTLLLVEDDGPVRALVAAVLRDEGYDVITAEDGGSAIAMLSDRRSTSNAPCLVILDMMLPAVDGVDVLRALADLGSCVPVVAMSADHERLSRAAAAGADAALTKPFDLAYLLSVVERNCCRSPVDGPAGAAAD